MLLFSLSLSLPLLSVSVSLSLALDRSICLTVLMLALIVDPLDFWYSHTKAGRRIYLRPTVPSPG